MLSRRVLSPAGARERFSARRQTTMGDDRPAVWWVGRFRPVIADRRRYPLVRPRRPRSRAAGRVPRGRRIHDFPTRKLNDLLQAANRKLHDQRSRRPPRTSGGTGCGTKSLHGTDQTHVLEPAQHARSGAIPRSPRSTMWLVIVATRWLVIVAISLGASGSLESGSESSPTVVDEETSLGPVDLGQQAWPRAGRSEPVQGSAQDSQLTRGLADHRWVGNSRHRAGPNRTARP